MMRWTPSMIRLASYPVKALFSFFKWVHDGIKEAIEFEIQQRQYYDQLIKRYGLEGQRGDWAKALSMLEKEAQEKGLPSSYLDRFLE
ncbi:hypothetical protein APY94_00135 [Thermococcus celericrescens]|uniref:Uncharacterized protein n=1 Tax=Thermococcus celericrescens TaxID=227598 RepID=A0A124EBP7_9EURY|nr:hypothetical protein [Thermococcus celericrescens]KUH34819.1 hypothetical protein APY94_00135 [Thermococcus celericrescens]